jgi:hypothetical protein
VLCFCPGLAWTEILLLMASCLAGITRAHHCSWLIN